MNYLTDILYGFRYAIGARESRSSLLNPPPWLAGIFGGGLSKSGAQVGEGTAFNVPTVAACVNILAQSIAMLPLKVYRRTATGAEEATDHSLSLLLKRKPGPAQTSYQWRAWAQTCLGLGGNAYSLIQRDRFFNITGIVPLKASDVQVSITAAGELVYEVTSSQGLGGKFPAHDIIHLRGLSSNGYTGRSPIADLRDSVGLALTSQEFAARSFANGNRKPGILLGKEGMTKPKADEIMNYWAANYSGAANAGKTPLIWGTTWQDMGMSNQDAELILTRKFEVEEIARAYRVPLTLLQSMEKSTSFGTGIAELSRGFVNYTLMPWLNNWEQELEDKLLTEDEKNANTGLFIKFNVGALLRGSPLEQAQKAEVERRCRLITVNEYRRQMDMNEFADNGANNSDWPLNAQESGQQAQERAALDAKETRAAEHRALVDTIRSLPTPEVNIVVENHVPKRGMKLVRDAKGSLLGTEPWEQN